ncbi:c-type cytochrome [Allopusillimonas ginsengisoli]|uniref:c-type cytochrome n=1 Tax=Allopusillimonas ginsengisoli TaxID=453575 RepID=UPI0010C217CA|nr:c-type cytochrome [Allopusillimonas ginsengisoli]
MNKRQTRLFAIGSTAFAAVVFLGLTVDSHRQFPKLTNADNISETVVRGQNVWHAYNCINCHTMFGEGAYYAPDLTKITEQRGVPYLTAFLKDPSQFYDEQKHRRIMPNLNMKDDEISDVIAFMDWVSKVDNQGWPPRPILVSGGSIPGTDLAIDQQSQQASDTSAPPGARPVSTDNNPIALGQALFKSAVPTCAACHSMAPGVNLAGPSLANLATVAEKTIASDDYKGKATNAEEFIRESIVEPSAYLHPGPMFSANGVSFMPPSYGKDLSKEDIDHLVAYLASFK